MHPDYPFEGRIEVLTDGVWGGVCNQRWSTQDAIVMCREMGYTGIAKALPITTE